MKLSTPQDKAGEAPTGGSGALLRQRNSSWVLDVVRRHVGALRVAEIAKITGLSRPTVETVAEGLLEQRWLRIAEPADQSRRATAAGRPARFYEFNEVAAYVMGADIGAHTVSVALGDLRGKLIATAKKRVLPEMPAESRIKVASDAITSLLAEQNVAHSAVLALTVGTPGTVSPKSSRVGISPGMPGWTDVNVRSALSAVLPCHVQIENDANLAVVGERARGVIAHASDAVFLLLGERLGAGIIARGELIRGRDGAAGELGYVSASGARSSDPRYGPLEAQVSASALVEMGREAVTKNPTSSLAGKQNLAAEDITGAANLGDETAMQVIQLLAQKIALGVAPTILTLNPEALVIGGGISRGGNLLRTAIAEALKDIVLYAPQVLISALGDEAVVVGAVSQSLERVEAAVLSQVSA